MLNSKKQSCWQCFLLDFFSDLIKESVSLTCQNTCQNRQCSQHLLEGLLSEGGQVMNEEIKSQSSCEKTRVDETCLWPNRASLMREGAKQSYSIKAARTQTWVSTVMHAVLPQHTVNSYTQSSQIPKESFHYAYTGTT